MTKKKEKMNMKIKKVIKIETKKKSSPKKIEPKYTIKDVKLDEILPNIIDGVAIYNDDNNKGPNFKSAIILPCNMNREMFINWLKGKGGILYQDLKDYNIKGIKHKYAMINKDTERTLVRLIEKDEYEEFNILGLINGKIKDVSYMIIKNLGEDEDIKSYKKEYINIQESDSFNEKIIVINTSNEIDNNDNNDYEANMNSISLFAD